MDLLKREGRYAKVLLKDHLTRLPAGIPELSSDSNEVVRVLRNVKFRDLSRSDISIIRNEKYAQQHPIGWMMRTICLVVESIEDYPVYDPYVDSEMKRVPDVIKSMYLNDCYSLLIMGHIHNFGSELPDLQATCGDCKAKQSTNITLDDLETEYSNDCPTILKVLLPKGVTIKDRDSGSKEIFKSMTFRPPTLADAYAKEAYYRLNDHTGYLDKVYASCLTSLTDELGNEVDEERLRLIAPVIFREMLASDSTYLEEVMNSLPITMTYITDECKNCSSDMPVMINTGFLYPMSR